MPRLRRVLFGVFAACTAWLILQNSVLLALALVGAWGPR